MYQTTLLVTTVVEHICLGGIFFIDFSYYFRERITFYFIVHPNCVRRKQLSGIFHNMWKYMLYLRLNNNDSKV